MGKQLFFKIGACMMAAILLMSLAGCGTESVTYPQSTEEIHLLLQCDSDATARTYRELADAADVVICGDVQQVIHHTAGDDPLATVTPRVEIVVNDVLKGQLSVGDIVYTYDNGRAVFDEKGVSGGQTACGGPFMQSGNRVLLFLSSGDELTDGGQPLYTITLPSLGKFFYDSDGLYHMSRVYGRPYRDGEAFPDTLTDTAPKTLEEIKHLIA